jgi:hypothetical protein
VEEVTFSAMKYAVELDLVGGKLAFATTRPSIRNLQPTFEFGTILYNCQVPFNPAEPNSPPPTKY